ncbi:MAG: PAS domain-containing protein, partial [Chitinophagales bacterium]
MSGGLLNKQTKSLFQAFEWVKWPMVLTDRNLHILHGNKAFRSLLDDAGFVFTAVDLPQVFPELQIILPLSPCYPEDAEVEAGLLEAVSMSGSSFFYDLAVSRIDGNESSIAGFILTCTDAGPRIEQKIEDAELSEHHRKYLKYTDAGVIIHKHGKIIYSNEQASKL